jgi:hypothetical protein
MCGMPSAFWFTIFLMFATFSPRGARAQSRAADAVQEPHNVTYCELGEDPAAHNHELVRLTAFLSAGFEDFTVAEPGCPKLSYHFEIWAMYGGKAKTNTIYCCPGEGGAANRSKSLSVEGIDVPLADDQVFQQFTNMLQKESPTTVRLTVVGTFFSGERRQYGDSVHWEGFGHLGCCSLLVIQRVEKFEQHTRKDLDYTSDAGWYEDEGCKWETMDYRRHVSITYDEEEAEKAIVEQKMADSGERAWAFTDPERVAIESLRPFYKDQTPVLRRVRKTDVQQVFRWRNGKRSIVVVVARPYWLSFYAASSSVAWVSTTIKEAGCS